MFQSRPHTKGAIIQMLDEPAPYKLTRALSSQSNFHLGFLHPGDDVMLGLPEVSNLESIESFGTAPDYQFSAVPEDYRGKYQVKLHVAENATEGERLVVVRNTQGQSHIGLIGIHISHQQAKPQPTSSTALVAQLSFDQNLNDSGPYKMQGQANGDQVLLRQGSKGKAFLSEVPKTGLMCLYLTNFYLKVNSQANFGSSAKIGLILT